MSKKITSLLILVLCFNLGLPQYITNPNRTQGVTNLCSQFASRDALVDADAQARNDEYMAGMKASFTTDGNAFILSAVNDPGSIASSITTTGTQLLIFVIPFVVGFVIILFIWMFLCCCCICPSCCPSKCCQKNQNEQYTKCELIWPTIVLILALLLSLTSSVIGLTSASDIQTSIKATTCAISITLDDILNGNVSSAGTFFVGISTFGTQIVNLKNQLTFVEGQLDNIDTSGPNAVTASQTAAATFQNSMRLIPKNVNDASADPISYGPFISSSSATVNSKMPGELGNTLDPSTSLGLTFTTTTLTQSAVDSTAGFADSFKAGVVSFNSGFDDSKNQIDGLADTIKGADDSIYALATTLNDVLQYITTAVTALFGVIIGFAVLGIVGALIMTFCSKYKCRYLVYFTCVILFIIGLVLFLLSIIFALLTPTFYFACQFFETSVSSAANFETNIGFLLGDQTDLISVCLPGSSGNILDTLGGDLTQSLTSLGDVVTSMNDFIGQDYATQVTNTWTSTQSLIDNYYSGHTLDFQLTQGSDQIRKLADHTQYTACTAGTFTSDSWVPSNLPGAAIACTISGGAQAGATQCPNSAAIDSSSGSCTGCMDIQQVLPISAAGTGVNTDLSNRYNSVGCTSGWVAEMTLVWDNYYGIKQTQYAGINSRASTSNTDFTAYVASINTIQTTFSDVLGNLSATVNSVVDPQYGLIAGFNCLIFGEDFQRVINTLCVKFFNTTYLARLTLGIAAFGILFAMCCSVCTGVRHYKHSERQNKLDALENTGSYGYHDSTMAKLGKKQ